MGSRGYSPTRYMESQELANNLDNPAGSYVLRCDCGRSMTTGTPLAREARYICAAWSSSRKVKNRLTRKRNEDRNAALRQRLVPFLKLPLEGHEREWFELAQELRIDAVALEALVTVVTGGKWQNSTAPLMYLRINVKRRSEEWEDPFSEDGRLRRAQIFSEVPTREDREWNKQWASNQEQSAHVTRQDIEAASQTLSVVQDEEERGVLCARALGLTRAQYLSGVSDPVRRSRAAAWKRLNRHGTPPELRTALRGASGDHAIIRPGFEDREWENSQDCDSREELLAKPKAVPRYDFQDDDWRTSRVIQYARR
jgi:hypothetical protein